MAEGFSLKDQLFNAQKVDYLARLIEAVDPGFNGARFSKVVVGAFPGLGLMERIIHIADTLDRMLPADFHEAVRVVERALPPPLDPDRTDDDFGDFIFAPLGELMVLRGLETHPGRALEAIEELTQRFSMEWAVRPFLNRWPEDTLNRFAAWAQHPSYHVRRLVSEGSRPRLPWGRKIGIDPLAPLPLLDRLHADRTRYVTRSVANHLNDIAKIAPDVVVARLRDWRDEGQQEIKELDWMTRHALRTLVRQGHPGALDLLGYGPVAGLRAGIVLAPGPVRIGGALAFTVTLEAQTGGPVLVDYVLGFHRPGRADGRKVFKLKTGRLAGGRVLRMDKRHKLRGDATTFRLHPGPHWLAVQVNGQIAARTEFDLEPSSG